jgi:hypothetical protein
MKKFIITEEERSRILGIHKSRTSRHYLMEQGLVPPSVTTDTTTVAPNNTEDKDELIEVLTDHINNMKTDKNFDAMSIAQTIYNDCAHFMNKTDVFANRAGEPLSSKASFAPRN